MGKAIKHCLSLIFTYLVSFQHLSEIGKPRISLDSRSPWLKRKNINKFKNECKSWQIECGLLKTRK